MLVFASAGVLEHAGIKIPYFSFFAHDSGRRVKEAPWNMLLAMGIAAFLSIFIGVNHRWLYALLPYASDYQPYTLGHIVGQMQLLLAAIFAFALLMRIGWYPSEKRMTILDVDWFWRKPGKALAKWVYAITARLWQHAKHGKTKLFSNTSAMLSNMLSPDGNISRTVPTGALAGWAVALLALALLGAYMAG
jgi:multicomponent Na+:H+ antiporter subunit D